MLKHISPPEVPNLAQLWTEDEYEKILNSLKGIKVSLGFGSSFNAQDGSLTITSLTEGSDAEKELMLQDRVVRIDNQGLSDLGINEVNQLLDGSIGSKSTLKVVRDIKIFDVRLTRDTLKTQNLVVTKIPNQSIALIEVKLISLGISIDIENELTRLKEDGMGKIILDLRNNKGGVLNEGINVSKLFMKSGNIVLRTQSRSEGVINYAASEDKFLDFEMALLINEKTASASEIIASALQDHKRAIIIGKKTFGKGVIETTFTLKNNYRVKFISSAMYSPKGHSWQSKGLLPDFFIDQTQANYQKVSKLAISERLKSDLNLSTAVKLLTP
ncbi:MAG: hypothetical protein GY816_06345 [Cytophagales bacterium]|nr:hypothetical protein [Cytophagales bacterium]